MFRFTLAIRDDGCLRVSHAHHVPELLLDCLRDRAELPRKHSSLGRTRTDECRKGTGQRLPLLLAELRPLLGSTEAFDSALGYLPLKPEGTLDSDALEAKARVGEYLDPLPLGERGVDARDLVNLVRAELLAL